MIQKKEDFTLLTFYKFVDVKNPTKEVEEHQKFTAGIGIKGRIYIGTEGISATVTGNEGQIMAYKLFINNHDLFKNPEDIDIKSCKVKGHQFPKMKVKVRDEIVVLGKKFTRKEIEEAGNRMQIEDFKEILDNGQIDDYIVLDMRNDHEYRLGHFKNAIPASTLTFRELENQIEEYKKQFGDKKVISYCTGGIRCEKSTVMLQKAGLKNTYQLDGGVVKYINTYDDGNWEGNLYVFDDRVSDEVGSKEKHTTIGICCYTGEKTDHCENCRYSPCNARLICKKTEYKKHFGFCSEECFNSSKNDFFIKSASFDSMNYKMKRADIKVNPELKSEIFETMENHLSKQLSGVVFSNKTTLREEYQD
ncbi:MAG: rhodanese-like domain-containing protein [Candidatus Gracilibacteria bacterium]|nr:rhodanese-like domain-containing protein [Candidatus Gracilibacteria bacterium]MDQ7022990.1 rhodanese-like domain-containing protein [Candidatus Gracilibacteria bacterium]